MEFVFGLTEGRRAVLYDEGNQIILLFIQRGRIINQFVLEREYHSELNAIVYGNKIYLAYMTVSYAIAWMELGGTGRIILYANDSDMCRVSNLQTVIIAGKLLLLYESEFEKKKTWRLQYILPLEYKKNYTLCDWEMHKDYQLSFVGDRTLLSTTCDDETKHYYIEEKDNQRFALNEIKIMQPHDLEKIKQEYVKKNEQVKLEQEQRKTQYEKEREQLEIEFKKQYNELVDFTKQLQEEGKHWREMYYRNVPNRPQNT